MQTFTETEFQSGVNTCLGSIQTAKKDLVPFALDAVQHVKDHGSTARILFILARVYNPKGKQGGAVFKAVSGWFTAQAPECIKIAVTQKTHEIKATCKGWDKSDTTWVEAPDVNPIDYRPEGTSNPQMHTFENELKQVQSKLKREEKGLLEDGMYAYLCAREAELKAIVLRQAQAKIADQIAELEAA